MKLLLNVPYCGDNFHSYVTVALFAKPGEGNGGVMLPDIHIGRDAPVAAALVLQVSKKQQ